MSGFFRRNGLLALIEIAGRLPLLFTLGYLASSVGPRVYGQWALVLAAVGVLTNIGALGLSSSISRLASGADASEAKGYLLYALRTSGTVGFVFGLVLLVAHDPVGAALGMREPTRDLLAVGGLLAVAGTAEAILDAWFKAREHLRRQGVLVLGRTCIEVATVVLVFGTDIFSAGAEGRLVLYVLLSFGARVVLLYPWLLAAPPRRAVHPGRPDRRAFLRYGLPMIPAGLVAWVVTQGDRLVLGHTVGAQELGWYAFAAALAWNLSYLTLAIYPLLLPRASVLYDRGDHDEVKRLFDASQRVYLGIFAGAAVALAFLAPDVVDVTAGSTFAPAAPILLILAVAVGLEGLLGIFSWVFHLVRRTSLVLLFNVLYMTLQVAAVFIVARATGDVLAVAWTALAMVIVANGVRYVVARRLYVIRASTDVVAAVAVLGAVLLAAAELGQQLPLGVRLPAAVVAGAVGTLAAVRAAQAGSAGDGQALRPTVVAS